MRERRVRVVFVYASGECICTLSVIFDFKPLEETLSLGILDVELSISHMAFFEVLFLGCLLTPEVTAAT